MDKKSFLSALDVMVRQQVTYNNQTLCAMAVNDMLRYISGAAMDFGLESFVSGGHDRQTYSSEADFCWCGVDKGPYGFSIRAFQRFTMDCQEIAHVLWEELYWIDEDGNEAMGEEEGVEYAKNMYENLEVAILGMKYQELGNLLDSCEIADCIYEMHENVFSCARNKEETLILLELIISSSRDENNTCGCLEKYILSLESPALDRWVEFVSSGRDSVAKEDGERFRIILHGLENEEITCEMASDGIELSSFSTGEGHPGGWYRTIIHDAYCFYNGYGVSTCFFFVYGLISLRYLAVMLDMQDFLREMDEKYHYLACREDGPADGMEVRL